MRNKLNFILFVTFFAIKKADGSGGRLLLPPGRSSLWRFPDYQAFEPVVNTDDDKLDCGGFEVFVKNGEKCGLCGDDYAKSQRENEEGGKYDKGIIAKKYREGSDINVTIQLTEDHKGHFEFRLCTHRTAGIPPSQSCFDSNLLTIVDPEEDDFSPEDGKKPEEEEGNVEALTKFNVTEGPDYYNLTLRLPKGLTCIHCLFQWTYYGGDRIGNCSDGTTVEEGCGPQHQSRACADISIF